MCPVQSLALSLLPSQPSHRSLSTYSPNSTPLRIMDTPQTTLDVQSMRDLCIVAVPFDAPSVQDVQRSVRRIQRNAKAVPRYIPGAVFKPSGRTIYSIGLDATDSLEDRTTAVSVAQKTQSSLAPGPTDNESNFSGAEGAEGTRSNKKESAGNHKDTPATNVVPKTSSPKKRKNSPNDEDKSSVGLRRSKRVRFKL
ncbi:hypothetical protein BDY19DRAFT_468015 [Irpex rosettiformis]|uniref:Uncharacterized protein n=1 Tax=Irpex rosettiformis TaxID=378272 RepID=A0ACB8TSN6_9APHY|nr:hypothetical protein BDY19DRAFT_468015 [Irpex rosettiformis]